MKRSSRGFTLVEVLIALSIFTVVAAAVYAALQTGLSGYARIDAAGDPLRKARIVFNRVERDLSRCLPYKEKSSGFLGDADSFSFYTVSDTYQGDSVQKRYCLVEYAQEGETLVKRSGCGVSALGASPQMVPSGVVGGISGMTVSYEYATGNSESPYAWGTQWPASEESLRQKQSKLLPLAVKISLQVIQYDSRHTRLQPAVYEKVIVLPLAQESADE